MYFCRSFGFIMLYKVVLTFEYVDEILKCDHSNEMKTTEVFDHSNKSY